jgi:hypothetical protein
LAELHQAWEQIPEEDRHFTYGDWLLDNGVSVELPPEPEVKPGTTATILAYGTRLRAIRVADGWYGALPDDGRDFHYRDHEVADFVPDPEPLTDDVVNRVVDEVWGGPKWNRMPPAAKGDVNFRVWHVLEPYVVKGGPGVG